MNPEIFLRIHSKVLFISLAIEKNTSFFLGQLLKINNTLDSRTLGNKNSSLSLNTKIDLLIDIGALDSDLKKVFLAFMEVRNQLMHNIEVTNYERCFSFLEGKDTFLIKRYKPDSSLNREKQLEYVVDKLGSEVFEQINKIIDIIGKKSEEDIQKKVHEISNNAYTESIAKLEDKVGVIITELLNDSNVFDDLRLFKFYKGIIDTLVSNFQEEVKKSTSGLTL